jgi:hypothetical protein
MATSDMSLGGGAGFGAGYTPIRFAPLVSLTGPVMAPATPAAPEAAAPMAPALRLPQMSDMPDNAYMTGEIPQFTGKTIGERSGAEIRGDLGRIGEFFINPLSTMASYAMTGKMPSEQMQGLLGGAAQPSGQGTPAAPSGGFLQGLQNFLFGPSVSLGGSSAGGLASQGPGMGSAVFSDALNAALASGASEEAAAQAGRTALGLFAQGMDPASAVALGSVTQISRNPFDMTSEQGIPSTPAGMPGLSRNLFDMTAPVAPQAAQTFRLGQPGQIESSTQIGGIGGADSPFSGFTGGNWGPGETLGGYDTKTGAYSDITGFE